MSVAPFSLKPGIAAQARRTEGGVFQIVHDVVDYDDAVRAGSDHCPSMKSFPTLLALIGLSAFGLPPLHAGLSVADYPSIQEAIDKKLSPNTIKKSIHNWKSDYMRV